MLIHYLVLIIAFNSLLLNRFDIIINGIGTIIHQLCVDITSPGGKVVTFTTTPTLTDKFQLIFGSLLSIVVQMMAWFKKVLGSSSLLNIIQVYCDLNNTHYFSN